MILLYLLFLHSRDSHFLSSSVIQKAAGEILFCFLRFCKTIFDIWDGVFQTYSGCTDLSVILVTGADKKVGQSSQSLCKENQKSVSNPLKRRGRFFRAFFNCNVLLVFVVVGLLVCMLHWNPLLNLHLPQNLHYHLYLPPNRKPSQSNSLIPHWKDLGFGKCRNGTSSVFPSLHHDC